MALNHTHKAFENFVLETHIEDQLNSKLDLLRFCTVDNSLVGVAGDKKVVRVYSATNGTEKLAMGEGNTQNIEATYEDKEYVINLSELDKKFRIVCSADVGVEEAKANKVQ